MSESSEKAQLILLISDKYYTVELIKFEGERKNPLLKGWKLTRFDDPLNHSPYCIIRQPSGRFTCDCAHFTFAAQQEAAEKSRQEKKRVDPSCKHIAKCEEVGLFK